MTRIGRYVGELRVADLSNNNGDLALIVRAIAASSRRVNPIVGVIFKITEGTGFVDSHAAAGIAEARRHGLIVGGYHFLHPDQSVKSQAKAFVTAARKAGLWHKGDFRPVLDYEIGTGSDSLRDEFFHEVHTLSKHLSIFYAGAGFAAWSKLPHGCEWWAPGYPHYIPSKAMGAPAMHQFTDRQNVGGHPMDMSRVLGGRKTLPRLVCHVPG
jgi:hypothetical protein